MERVLITGMGAFNPLGANRQATFSAAVEGISAVRFAPSALTEFLPPSLMAPAIQEPEPLLERKYSGLDRATHFALLAAQEAVEEAGWGPDLADAEKIGTYAGVGMGGAKIIDDLYHRFFKNVHANANGARNPAVMHPLSVPRMMPNASASMVAMRYGLKGPSNTYTVACASSAVALGEAYRAIKHGYLSAAVVLGTEAMLNSGSLTAWNALRVMAKPVEGRPEASCRPFSSDRTGFVLGEGAACLVLESESRVQGRGASPLAELAGYGSSSDAEHLTLPQVDGQSRAMRQALHEAGVAPEQVQYLNAHGTATDAGDVVESQSIRAVFGEAANSLPVSSTKAVHGHLIGAGGALEFVLAVMAMQSGSLPPTAHLEHPDPRCDLDYIPNVARHGRSLDVVMSNSFAFGGSNAALIARRWAA